VSAESQGSVTSGQSRRSFLVKLGLGVAGLAGMSSGLVRFGKKESTGSTGEFPGPDSIFHPAQDPRTDPRRG
jgi:hypothetical protein